MNYQAARVAPEETVFRPVLPPRSTPGFPEQQMIGAIETQYKGYNFRSRLEARWAVFFDSMGIEWQYEPQGFQVGESLYLPDFWLPVSKTWVEVKGSDEALLADRQRIVNVLDWASPMPNIEQSLDTTSGLLLLGPIPERHFGLILHPLIQHHKGLTISWASFFVQDEPLLLVPAHRDWIQEIAGLPERISSAECNVDGWSVMAKCVKTQSAIGTALSAYEAARTARFEHGYRG